MEKSSCLQCGIEIDKYSSFIKNNKKYYKKEIRKYCSSSCSSSAKIRKYKNKCLNCDIIFESKVKLRNFCSHKCSGKYIFSKKILEYIPIHKKYPKKTKTKNKCILCGINNIKIKFCKSCFDKKEKERGSCRYKIKKHKAKILKQKIINDFGGCCQNCGYNKCQRALTFHHINSKDKKFTIDISNLIKKKESQIIEESKKCQLLCQNCHAIHHEKERILNNKNKIKYNNKKILIYIFNNKCEKCSFTNEHTQAMTFHHKDKNTKLFELNSKNINKKQWEEILKEASKCSLLCFNCHMEEETLLYEQSINNISTLN